MPSRGRTRSRRGRGRKLISYCRLGSGTQKESQRLAPVQAEAASQASILKIRATSLSHPSHKLLELGLCKRQKSQPALPRCCRRSDPQNIAPQGITRNKKKQRKRFTRCKWANLPKSKMTKFEEKKIGKKNPYMKD